MFIYLQCINLFIVPFFSCSLDNFLSLAEPQRRRMLLNILLNRTIQLNILVQILFKVNCAQIQNKTKRKLFSNTNFCICQRTIRVPNECSQKVSQYIAIGVVHSSILAWIFSVHRDKVLAWLSLRTIYVRKASFSKNLLQIAEINFLPTISKANGFSEANFPPCKKIGLKNYLFL